MKGGVVDEGEIEVIEASTVWSGPQCTTNRDYPPDYTVPRSLTNSQPTSYLPHGFVGDGVGALPPQGYRLLEALGITG